MTGNTVKDIVKTLEDLLKNPAKIELLRTNARKRSLELSWDNAAQITVQEINTKR